MNGITAWLGLGLLGVGVLCLAASWICRRIFTPIAPAAPARPVETRNTSGEKAQRRSEFQ